MKKCVLFSVSIAIIAVIFSVVVFASAPKTTSVVVASGNTDVITIAENVKSEPKADKVLEARFLNMLNRNFVYDSAFDNVEDVVNCSMIALLDMRDSEEEFISESIVSDFVYNMYGIEGIDYSLINSDFSKKEGYVYILPRGYELYSHKVESVSLNEDGSYTVKTNVSISTHDGLKINEVCETLFVKNDASSFGFNIVYSNIGAPASAV